MQSRSDLELLREYARTGAQDAFAAVVFRHVDLVYTAARRQVRDPHLAEDVTQAVFLVLARKAGAIGSKVVLEGWLLNATRFAARDALRRRKRQQRHELAAAQQRNQQVQRGTPASSTAAELQESVDRLDSLLDSALARLGAHSRDAVILRFFQNKSFHDVGQELGIGEEAAKQRVSRGLRQLRKFLVQSGLDLPLEGLGGLGSVLGARGIMAAPAGLAHSIAAGGGRAALAGAGSASIAKGAITLMAYTKVKIAAVAVAGLLFLSGGAVVVHHYVAAGPTVVVLKPDAPLPAGTGVAPTPVSWGPGVLQAPVVAYAGPAITGTVLDPSGKPLADAEVFVSSNHNAVNVYPTARANAAAGTMTKTSGDGHFELTPTEQPSAVVVRASVGYAAALVLDPAKPMSIRVAPWARLEGIVRAGSKVVPQARVQVAQYGNQEDWNRWHVIKEQTIECDENGHFVVERVVPGLNVIGRLKSRVPMPQRFYKIDLPAGKTTVMNIGGDSRTVVGHLPPAAAAFSFRNGQIQRPQPQMPLPPDWDKLDEAHRRTLQQAFWNTPKYKAWQENANVAQFDVGKDGTFRVDDIPAGDYQVSIQVGDTSGGSYFVESAGWGETPVTVPPVSPDQLDVPLDVGEVNVKFEKRMAIGDAAPEISGDALDGSPARLSDQRGKYVLLYLWASDRQDMLEKLDMLRALNDRFGDDPRFTIVGLDLDQSPDAARKAVRERQMRWPQILLHGWDDQRLSRVYTLSPANLFLIGPEGRLVAKNTDVPGMFSVLQGALSAPQMPGVSVDRQLPGEEGAWETISGPDNVARHAVFSLVDGQIHSQSQRLDCLHDGVLPQNADAPAQCFFFEMGTMEGRFKIDLGSVIPIAQVNTYSWHKLDRGPQVYRLYAAAGDAPGFNPAPKIGTDPATCGWKQVAFVDTRPQSKPVGGRYTVHITDPSGALGSYRYLLFETYVSETADQYGHTFYGEVEVIRHH